VSALPLVPWTEKQQRDPIYCRTVQGINASVMLTLIHKMAISLAAAAPKSSDIFIGSQQQWLITSKMNQGHALSHVLSSTSKITFFVVNN
jgi:hypothetical protein